MLKIRWEDFETQTKRVSLDRPIYKEEDLLAAALELYELTAQKDLAIRLLGITLTNLGKEQECDLLEDKEESASEADNPD